MSAATTTSGRGSTATSSWSRGSSSARAGRPRTLEQGKKESAAIYEQLRGGGDFGKLARERSEDPDAIRKANGIVPFWITSDTPGYQDTFKQAAQLTKDSISQPFFSEGRGYVIVKLLDRRAAAAYEAIKADVRADAARYRYDVWRNERTRAATVNADLFEEGK
jgi:parvulin-like peptidyl-prolyl isomerase